MEPLNFQFNIFTGLQAVLLCTTSATVSPFKIHNNLRYQNSSHFYAAYSKYFKVVPTCSNTGS